HRLPDVDSARSRQHGPAPHPGLPVRLQPRDPRLQGAIPHGRGSLARARRSLAQSCRLGRAERVIRGRARPTPPGGANAGSVDGGLAGCIRSQPSANMPLTYADWAAMPEDGKRYELIEGELVLSPSPNNAHQRILGHLYLVLNEHVSRHK